MVAVNGATVRKGFRLPERTAKINFEGTDYDGAEIQLRLSVSFAQFIALRESAQGEDQEGIRERDYTGPPRFFCHHSDDRLLSLVSGLLEVVSFEQVDIGSKTLFTPISSRSPCGEPTNLPRSLPARSAFQRSQRHCPADDANTRDGAQTLEQGHPVPANGYQGPERVQQVCDRVERGND